MPRVLHDRGVGGVALGQGADADPGRGDPPWRGGGAALYAAVGEPAARAVRRQGRTVAPRDVTVETPDTAPVFSRAALSPSAEGESRYLQVLFNELLDEDSQPAGRAFTVTARPSGGRTRTVAGTGTVNVNGSLVAIELASPVTHARR